MTSFERRAHDGADDMRSAWEVSAPGFIAWARAPDHDTYWRGHRDLFLELVPPPGRLTLDIGCGEGRLARDLAALGHRVVGIDGSPTMVEHARAADPSIEVHLADAAALPLADASADLAVAFMSLRDIDDAAGAIREAARVLEPGGRLCACITHPLADAGRWESREPDAAFVVEGSYFGRRRFEGTFMRDGLEITFRGWCYPLEEYARALEDAGFLVEALREPPAPESEARADPSAERWRRVPNFLCFRAYRP